MQRSWWLLVVMGICVVSCRDGAEQPAEEVVATTERDPDAPATGKALGKLSKKNKNKKKSGTHVNTVASKLPACMFDDAVSCIDPPVIRRWDCPTPWVAGREGTGETPVVCRPPEVPSKCGPGEYTHPGSAGCVRAGDPCPAGGWPVIEDQGEFVLYVKPGGMGDGMSPDQPLGDIQTAHNFAIQGSIILVAPGTYTTPLFINKEVTLIGACSATTKIAPPKSAKGDAISIISPATIKNFTISGGSWGVFVKSSGVTTLEGLVIEGVRLGAVSVFGDGVSTRVVLKNTAVRDIRLDGTVGEGFGISIQEATASLESVSINNVYNFGLTALSSTLTLKDVSIENIMSFSKSEEKGYGGIAVVATTVKAERLVVRGSENVGIGGWSGSVFELTDVMITDSIGPGIFFVDSRAEIAQMQIHNMEEDAIVLSNSSLELEHFRVLGVNGSQEIDNGTNAIVALNGSELNAHNGVLDNNGETTLYFSRSSGAMADLSVKGTGNAGISIRDASLVDAERILIKDKAFGIIVGPAWRKNTISYANLTHIRILNARGYGIRATDSLVAGHRIEVRQSPVGFISQGEQSIVMLEEVEFSDCALESAVDPYSQNAYFSGGIGLLAHKGSRTILSTSRLHNNRNANLILAGDYTIAELDHTRLEHSPDEALKKVVQFEIGGKRLAAGSRKTFEHYGIATFDKSRLTSETEAPEKPRAPVKPKGKIVTARVDPAGSAPTPASPGGLTGAALGSGSSTSEPEEGDEEGQPEEAAGAEDDGEKTDALGDSPQGEGEGAKDPAQEQKSAGAAAKGPADATDSAGAAAKGPADATDSAGAAAKGPAESPAGAVAGDAGLAGEPEEAAGMDGPAPESPEAPPGLAQAAAGGADGEGLAGAAEAGLAGGMDGPDEGQNALDEAAAGAAETDAGAAMKMLKKSSSDTPEFGAEGLDGLLEGAGDSEEEPEEGSLSAMMNEGLSAFENLEIDDSKNEFLMGEWRTNMDVEKGSKSAAKAALMKELGIDATDEEQAGMKAQGDAAVKDGLAMIKRMSKRMKGNALANGMKAIAHMKKQQGKDGDLSGGVFGDLSGSEAEEFLAKLEEKGGTEAVEEWLKDATENGTPPNILRDKNGEPLRDDNGELMLREKSVVDYFSGFLPAVPGRPRGVTESDNLRGLLEGYAAKYVAPEFTTMLRMAPKALYYLCVVLLATLLIGFFPSRVNCVVEAMETSPLGYAASGVVITFLGGSTIALMTFSVVFAPIGFFLALIFSFCWALGVISLGISIMESLPFLGLAKSDRDIPYLLGLALMIGLMSIPEYGLYIFYATLCPCIGAAYATRLGTDTWVRK